MYKTQEFPEHIVALEHIDDFPNTNFIRGSGYVVDTLWTSIDCLKKSDSYISAVRAAICYGIDTDTTACVTGGLAGIKYGRDNRDSTQQPVGIPLDWILKLKMTEESTRILGYFS
jgi:ADP-ribosylglycohydrolase